MWPPQLHELPTWRLMTAADLDFVEALAAELYPDHPESRASFAGKLAAAPKACFVADVGGRNAGYCIALWTEMGRPPRLDEVNYLPRSREALHLHDIAVSPSARGQGLVGEALLLLSVEAAGMPLSLVAVHGTRPLWELHGFSVAPADAGVLASYGGDAVYMSRLP